MDALSLHPSPVFTHLEAAIWLRLVEQGASPAANKTACDAVDRLVWKGKLRPLSIGKGKRFTLAELERFLRDEGFRSQPDG